MPVIVSDGRQRASAPLSQHKSLQSAPSMPSGAIAKQQQLCRRTFSCAAPQVRTDPKAVLKLRCLFLKLRSMLELPLLRIGQDKSPATGRVADFYSASLLAYVRRVLQARASLCAVDHSLKMWGQNESHDRHCGPRSTHAPRAGASAAALAVHGRLPDSGN